MPKAFSGFDFVTKDVTKGQDLALEIDVTSRTHPETYAALGVPELWRRSGDQIQIYRLQDGRYREVNESLSFPGWLLPSKITMSIKQSRVEGRNKAIRAFRQWVRQEIKCRSNQG